MDVADLLYQVATGGVPLTIYKTIDEELAKFTYGIIVMIDFLTFHPEILRSNHCWYLVD